MIRVAILCWVLLQVGCASTLYMRGEPVGGSARTESAGVAMQGYQHTSYGQYRQGGPKVLSNTNYFEVLEASRLIQDWSFHGVRWGENTNAGHFGHGAGIGSLEEVLFDFTPVGVLAPLFGYPHVLGYQISGRLRLQFDPPLDPKADQLSCESRPTNPSGQYFEIPMLIPTDRKYNGRTEIALRLNPDFAAKLHAAGRADRLEPSEVHLAISCREHICTASADPAIVTETGVIHVRREHVEDKKRLAEIDRERREELQRVSRERARERMLQERQDEKCPALYVLLYGLQSPDLVLRHGAIRVQDAAQRTLSEWSAYRCDEWLQRRLLYGQ